jgi:hypothetical protein
MASRRFWARGKAVGDAVDQPVSSEAAAGNQQGAAVRRPVAAARGKQASQSADPVADDLMRRVISAIDDWIIANGLDALPRHIAFQQALSILNALDRVYADRYQR